jgi:hypothetical protein
LTPAWGCRTDLPTYVALRPSTKPYAGVNFIPSVRDYEFGYRLYDCLWINSAINGVVFAAAFLLIAMEVHA